jgi:hypothetical protein
VRYPKEHILVVFYDSTFAKKSSSRAGVFTIASAKTEGAFVTLEKCEKQFSATTIYHDYVSRLSITAMYHHYAISPTSCAKLMPDIELFCRYIKESVHEQKGPRQIKDKPIPYERLSRLKISP